MASPKRSRQRQRRLLEESDAGAATQLRGDIVDLGEAAIRADGTIPIKLISPGWGSKGFYSAEALQQAGKDGVFPAGTQMFWDHPSLTERSTRPERSLRDLAAVTESAATWRDDPKHGPGLFAEARVFAPYRELINEMAPHIGVSIRALGHASPGEAEGRRGPIVESITDSVSVDFVTKAGRGGQILSIFEAAGHADLLEARNVGEWFQSRIHLDFTTRADDMFGEGRLTKEERIALSSGIGAALDAFSTTVEELTPQLLTRDLWVDPAATETTESHQEDHMDKQQLDEAVAAAVDAKLTPVTTELAETKAELETTKAELAEAKATGTSATEALRLGQAKDHVGANDKVKALPAIARNNLIEAVAHEATLDEAGKLDTAKLDEAITKAVDAKVAELAEAQGTTVTGVGGTGGPAPSTEVLEAAQARVTSTFKELGLSDEEAAVATAGRS